MPKMLRAVKVLLANINHVNRQNDLRRKDLPFSSVLLGGTTRVRLSVAFIVCLLYED